MLYNEKNVTRLCCAENCVNNVGEAQLAKPMDRAVVAHDDMSVGEETQAGTLAIGGQAGSAGHLKKSCKED